MQGAQRDEGLQGIAWLRCSEAQRDQGFRALHGSDATGHRETGDFRASHGSDVTEYREIGAAGHHMAQMQQSTERSGLQGITWHRCNRVQRKRGCRALYSSSFRERKGLKKQNDLI